MTTAKFSAKITVAESFVSQFECSERTTRVDLVQIKTKANELLGTGFALAWAIKFALHGLRLKGGDYVKVKGNIMTSEDYTSKVSSQTGYHSKKEGGIEKHSDKTLVSAKRLVRAFAADISFLITKGLKLSDETTALATKSGLDFKFCFIDSWYGCDDAELKVHASNMARMCSEFDAIIQEAKAHDWLEGTKPHSHLKEFYSYMTWRGFAIET